MKFNRMKNEHVRVYYNYMYNFTCVLLYIIWAIRVYWYDDGDYDSDDDDDNDDDDDDEEDDDDDNDNNNNNNNNVILKTLFTT